MQEHLLTLSREELQELTKAKARKTMIANLRAMGFNYVLGADGWPQVGREHALEVLAGKSNRRNRPNLTEA